MFRTLPVKSFYIAANSLLYPYAQPTILQKALSMQYLKLAISVDLVSAIKIILQKYLHLLVHHTSGDHIPHLQSSAICR